MGYIAIVLLIFIVTIGVNIKHGGIRVVLVCVTAFMIIYWHEEFTLEE